jgi:ubiquinone/menaquinone biosynthesis C-methylase UbiE
MKRSFGGFSMSSIPKKFTSEYYDEDYFKTPEGKKFRRADGSMDAWSYANPNGESSGCDMIVKAWKQIFQPKNMLDVGCGRGTVVAYARKIGIDAYGFDFSSWAINEGRYPNCEREWLKVHDATKPWPYEDKCFDLITALDLLEHIYLDDLDFVISELHRVSKKWIFLQTAIAGSGGLQGREETGYILIKGQPVPIELEGCAVAGHVTLRKETWWYDKLEHEYWMPRKDMVNWFISLVDSAIIKNWLLNSIMVFQRLE